MHVLTLLPPLHGVPCEGLGGTRARGGVLSREQCVNSFRALGIPPSTDFSNRKSDKLRLI